MIFLLELYHYIEFWILKYVVSVVGQSRVLPFPSNEPNNLLPKHGGVRSWCLFLMRRQNFLVFGKWTTERE